MSIDLRNACIMVTGAYGFLGQHLADKLAKRFGSVITPPHPSFDLLNPDPSFDLLNPESVDWTFEQYRPTHVFHLAGYNGGIGFNKALPADIFYRNTVMGLNVLEACRRYNAKKVVSVVASCAYPDGAEGYHEGRYQHGIMDERDFFRGEPHATVACHGYAKRNLQLASAFYRRQYGLNAVCACPTTLYGPGDSFDPARTKVMGAMVKKFADAVFNGDRQVTCWGTGHAMREFLYVEDCAKLLVQVLEHYDDSELPLNLGSGQELSIAKLAETVAASVGFYGTINWDTTKPDGQLRKRLSMTRQNKLLPGLEFTALEEGISRTVDYYRSTRS